MVDGFATDWKLRFRRYGASLLLVRHCIAKSCIACKTSGYCAPCSTLESPAMHAIPAFAAVLPCPATSRHFPPCPATSRHVPPLPASPAIGPARKQENTPNQENSFDSLHLPGDSHSGLGCN